MIAIQDWLDRHTRTVGTVGMCIMCWGAWGGGLGVALIGMSIVSASISGNLRHPGGLPGAVFRDAGITRRYIGITVVAIALWLLTIVAHARFS